MEEKRQGQWGWMPFALGGGILLVLLFLLISSLLPKGSAPSISIRTGEHWTDFGAIEDGLFFRDGDALMAVDTKGTRWSLPIAAETKVAYTTHIWTLAPDGTLAKINPTNGNIMRQVKTEYQSIFSARARSGKETTTYLIATKKDRFLLLDQDANVAAVQTTNGTPGLFAQTERWRAWTETGTPIVPSKVQGTLTREEDMPALTTMGTKSRTVMTATPLDPAQVPSKTIDETDEKNDAKPSILERARFGRMPAFRAPAPANVQKILPLGEDSFLFQCDNALFFVKAGVLVHAAYGPVTGVQSEDSGVWALIGRDLVQFQTDGKEQQRIPFDFEPKALAIDQQTILVLGETRRLRVEKGKTTVEETAPFVSLVLRSDGTPRLIYREEVQSVH